MDSVGGPLNLDSSGIAASHSESVIKPLIANESNSADFAIVDSTWRPSLAGIAAMVA
jgi:hypothetical protein